MKLSTLLLLVFISGATLHAQKEYQLRYAFPEGKTLKYKKTESTNAQITGPGGTEEKIDRTSEARIHIIGETSDPALPTYLFVQDTLFSEEQSPEQFGFNLSDMYSAINGKKIRITLSPRGDMKSVHAVDSIVFKHKLPVALTDTMLAGQAVIFPPLPEKKIKIGESWTETRIDTLSPKFAVEGMASGATLTIKRYNTTYKVEGIEKKKKFDCLKLTWKSAAKSESKFHFGEMEVYSDEDTNISGTLYFAYAEGYLIEMKQSTYTEATTAMVSSQENATMPSSTQIESTLTLLP